MDKKDLPNDTNRLIGITAYNNKNTYLEEEAPIYKLCVDNAIEEVRIDKIQNHEVDHKKSTKRFEVDKTKPYTRVLLNNGQYGYVDNNGLLQDISFDVAFDYNDLGFAMVGLMGYVTWINSEFKYLSYKHGTFKPFKDYVLDLYGRKVFDGFNKIEEFKSTMKNDYLSKVTHYGDDTCLFLSSNSNNPLEFQYSSLDGQLQNITTKFKDSKYFTEFNPDGVNFNLKNGMVLFEDGKYFTSLELVNLLYKSDLIDKKLKLIK